MKTCHLWPPHACPHTPHIFLKKETWRLGYDVGVGRGLLEKGRRQGTLGCQPWAGLCGSGDTWKPVISFLSRPAMGPLGVILPCSSSEGLVPTQAEKLLPTHSAFHSVSK